VKRIGIAMGNTLTGQAQPLSVIKAIDNATRFKVIGELIEQWRPARLVVGEPRHPDGAEHEMTLRARRFANQLNGRFNLPVELVDERYSSSLSVTDDVAFTTSIDVLEAVANGTGPQRMLVSIGYAGWSPGQLEEEIARNGWLTVGADARVLFDLPIEERYNAAIKLLGIDPLMLASEAGHA
jgi:putative transcription antitermination factor YqgF